MTDNALWIIALLLGSLTGWIVCFAVAVLFAATGLIDDTNGWFWFGVCTLLIYYKLVTLGGEDD